MLDAYKMKCIVQGFHISFMLLPLFLSFSSLSVSVTGTAMLEDSAIVQFSGF